MMLNSFTYQPNPAIHQPPVNRIRFGTKEGAESPVTVARETLKQVGFNPENTPLKEMAQKDGLSPKVYLEILMESANIKELDAGLEEYDHASRLVIGGKEPDPADYERWVDEGDMEDPKLVEIATWYGMEPVEYFDTYNYLQ